MSLIDMPAWQALQRHAEGCAGRHLRALFADDPNRVEALSLEAAGLYLDASKQRLVPQTLELLVALARERGLPAAIEAMFAGETINTSENRAAWHIALRAPEGGGVPAAVHEELAAMAEFVDAVRAGNWRGFADNAITDVVNLGIGGSDLGLRLVCRALAPRRSSPQTHFVANVDPDDLDSVLAGLDARRTLFVVTSKSFATAETLANARAARAWLRAAGAEEDDVARHFVAVSTNREVAKAFGVEQIFGFWDWVGGRFSLWSAVGLTIALGLGMETFRALLAGAHAMDNHFRRTPLCQNLPVLLGLIGVWNRNFLGLASQVVVPYAQRLAHFPGWLQQLEMESNGKAMTCDGNPAAVATVASVWGGVGTNAQHAFFQMLHQGCEILPVDFILPLAAPGASGDRRRQLIANCLAQAEALMWGRDDADIRTESQAAGLAGEALAALVAQRRFAGNRPSSMLLLGALDAGHLGALLAAYEHKVFVQGVLWGINSFDQWGVELGKILADRILDEWDDPDAGGQHDASTASLLNKVRRGR